VLKIVENISHTEYTKFQVIKRFIFNFYYENYVLNSEWKVVYRKCIVLTNQWRVFDESDLPLTLVLVGFVIATGVGHGSNNVFDFTITDGRIKDSKWRILLTASDRGELANCDISDWNLKRIGDDSGVGVVVFAAVVVAATDGIGVGAMNAWCQCRQCSWIIGLEKQRNPQLKQP
jgi:hypothetical protein